MIPHFSNESILRQGLKSCKKARQKEHIFKRHRDGQFDRPSVCRKSLSARVGFFDEVWYNKRG